MQSHSTPSRTVSPQLPVWQYLKVLYDRHLPTRSGSLANYIPELARVDPDQFGIAIATNDGFVYDVGDSGSLFTIQSISKAIVYGLALEDHGRDEVLRRIGVEPSGDAFNAIEFDERHNRPFNPMVNSGAIAAAALVKGGSLDERFDRIVEMFRKFSGRALTLDEAVYRSESQTGHRNRAIAYLELNAGMIDGRIDDHLDLYFRQCSLLVTARDLAIIGATLANGGINPVTGEQALAPEYVRSVLSVMNTCGMYDYAGAWQFDIGLPAKSGVGGGITAVLPGHLGIGVFSPLLDAVGNSKRGVDVCADISTSFGLHLFESRRGGLVPFRRVYRGNEVRSRRVRCGEDGYILDRLGHHIVVYELQGEIGFVEAERVTRRLVRDAAYASRFIVDLTRVLRMDSVGFDMFNNVRSTLEEQGKTLSVVSISPEIPAAFDQAEHFPAVDQALEHLEDALIEREGGAATRDGIPLEGFEWFTALSAESMAAIRAHLHRAVFERGERLIAQDADAAELFFLIGGRVDVVVHSDAGAGHRVSTIDAGNIFGELALFGRAPRTASVIAATRVEVLVLDITGMAALRRDHADAFTDLLVAVGGSLADRLRRANTEIGALSK